jgi:hypothetical protein
MEDLYVEQFFTHDKPRAVVDEVVVSKDHNPSLPLQEDPVYQMHFYCRMGKQFGDDPALARLLAQLETALFSKKSVAIEKLDQLEELLDLQY